ncbi:MAG: phospholipid carrier-dependent glycosyltransferase [Candidatus Zixiibacteriota bacterium]
MNTDDNNTSLLKILVIVFGVALTLRLVFFICMVNQVDPATLGELSPDMTGYVNAAHTILDNFSMDSRGVIIFGPGYPVFLAIALFIFRSLVAAIILQIVISSLASSLLALLAYNLTQKKSIALTAGLFNSISLTSISLANAALSDTLFFILILTGFLLYLRILEKIRSCKFLEDDPPHQPGYWKLAVLTGLIFSAATLTRSIGLFVFIILIIYTYFIYRAHPNRGKWIFWYFIKPSMIITIIMLSITAGWVIRNYSLYDMPSPALSGLVAQFRMAAFIESKATDVDYDSIFQLYGNKISASPDSSLHYYGRYGKIARSAFKKVMTEYPLLSVKMLAQNINSNVHCESELHGAQVPEIMPLYRRIIKNVYKKGLNYRETLLCLLGLAWMIRKKQYLPAILLSMIWVYFAILSGFTLWQGSRIFYPGQISTSILMAAAIYYSSFLFIEKFNNHK